MSQEESLQLLNKHRSVRPISPHLTIYRVSLSGVCPAHALRCCCLEADALLGSTP
jgi:hypothetical protein